MALTSISYFLSDEALDYPQFKESITSAEDPKQALFDFMMLPDNSLRLASTEFTIEDEFDRKINEYKLRVALYVDGVRSAIFGG